MRDLRRRYKLLNPLRPKTIIALRQRRPIKRPRPIRTRLARAIIAAILPKLNSERKIGKHQPSPKKASRHLFQHPFEEGGGALFGIKVSVVSK